MTTFPRDLSNLPLPAPSGSGDTLAATGGLEHHEYHAGEAAAINRLEAHLLGAQRITTRLGVDTTTAAWDDFWTSPDESLHGHQMPSGQTMFGKAVNNGVDSPTHIPKVVDGVVRIADPTGGGNAAGYAATYVVGEKVVGGTLLYGFDEGADNNAAVAIEFSRTPSANAIALAADSVHINGDDEGISIGVVESAVLTNLFTHTFDTPLPDDGVADKRLTVRNDGDTVYVKGPDGETFDFTDPRIGALWPTDFVSGVVVELVRPFATVATDKEPLLGGFSAITENARPPRTLADHYIDAGNTHATNEIDLYTDTLPEALLGQDGDKIHAFYGGIIVGHATATRRLRVYFGGTVVFDSTAIVSAAGSAFGLRVEIIRVSSTTVRVVANAQPLLVAGYTEVTGLDLGVDQIIKITGQAGSTGAAIDDIVMKQGVVSFDPAV